MGHFHDRKISRISGFSRENFLFYSNLFGKFQTIPLFTGNAMFLTKISENAFNLDFWDMLVLNTTKT